MRALAAVSLCLLMALMAVASARAVSATRVSDLTVVVHEQQVSVHAVVTGALPSAHAEALTSGMPADLRITFELWQANRMWPDRLLRTRTLERQVTYNPVSQEFTVTSLGGELREPVVTRTLVDAEQALSTLRTRLIPAAPLDATELFYVRARAEVVVGPAPTLLTDLTGDGLRTRWARSALHPTRVAH